MNPFECRIVYAIGEYTATEFSTTRLDDRSLTNDPMRAVRLRALESIVPVGFWRAKRYYLDADAGGLFRRLR
jgi:hypothetical protein